MRRLLLTCAAAAAIIALSASGRAYYAEGPWCAGQNIGWTCAERCTLPSFEVCLDEVLAGNRGVCYRNPNWPAQAPAARGKRKRR